MSQEALHGAYKVLYLLRRYSHCEAIVSSWQAGHKNLHTVYLASIYVYILHLATGKVKESLFSTYVEVLEDCRCRLVGSACDIPVEMLLELGNPIGTYRLLAVFLPKQLHCHMGALQLRRKVRKHRLQFIESGV